MAYFELCNMASLKMLSLLATFHHSPKLNIDFSWELFKCNYQQGCTSGWQNLFSFLFIHLIF